MITDFNKMREYVEPPDLSESSAGQIGEYTFRLEYARTMATIQIAQELHDIKNLLGNLNQRTEIFTKLSLGTKKPE